MALGPFRDLKNEYIALRTDTLTAVERTKEHQHYFTESRGVNDYEHRIPISRIS